MVRPLSCLDHRYCSYRVDSRMRFHCVAPGSRAEFRHGNRQPDRPPRDRRIADADGQISIGRVVKHRVYPFRGVIFDVDPVFANTEEWLASIPEEVRPRRDQPFYHLLAENAQTTYVAYVSEQNLLPDETGKPVSHRGCRHFFKEIKRGQYISRVRALHGEYASRSSRWRSCCCSAFRRLPRNIPSSTHKIVPPPALPPSALSSRRCRPGRGSCRGSRLS